MLGKVAATLEMINTRKIGFSTFLSSIQPFGAIDATRLGRFQASPPTFFESLIRAASYVDEE